MLGQVFKANLPFELLRYFLELVKQWLYVEQLLLLDIGLFENLVCGAKVVRRASFEFGLFWLLIVRLVLGLFGLI